MLTENRENSEERRDLLIYKHLYVWGKEIGLNVCRERWKLLMQPLSMALKYDIFIRILVDKKL